MTASMRRIGLMAAFGLVAHVCLVAQAPQVFQFFVSATDAAGVSVSDLRAEDVVMSENGVRQDVVRVERVPVPIKITIAVDNGLLSGDLLVHYRSGLKAFVEALPPDIEMTIISTSPQPRTVVRPTTDRVQILRGINAFAPERSQPRFTDALVEFSERLQKEGRERGAKPYLPVLIMLSTSAPETRSYQAEDINKAMNFLVARHAKVNVIVVSNLANATGTSGSDSNLQALMAVPLAKVTGGRFESLASSGRIATLLPDWGADLALLHARQIGQYRVTVERARAGELQNPRIELARPGLSGSVTVDGMLP